MKRLILSLALACVCAPHIFAAEETKPADAKQLAVGDMAPDFEVADESGKPVKLSAYRGKSNVVLLFSRAYW